MKGPTTTLRLHQHDITMRMNKELHIFEKSAHLFWGLVILVCTAIGTYLLAGSFVTMHWSFLNLNQLAALALFAISFWGIIKLSEPLYHLTLFFDDRLLVIEVRKGDLHTDTFQIPVDEIQELRFAPHDPRSADEALFDFSQNYHLLYKTTDSLDYKKLLGLQSAAITLKVDDIADIMRFISSRNSQISIPPEQASYFNL